MCHKAVFLDRDGTIGPDVNYCSRPEDFELFPDSGEAIRLLNENGFKVVVITNQSGIARGYFSEDTLDRIHHRMKCLLDDAGAKIDAIYYCPHHPAENCDCRKPKTRMFRQAAEELDIDLSHSYVIGDTETDIIAGKTLMCKTGLVTTRYKASEHVKILPDYINNSLQNIVEWIISG